MMSIRRYGAQALYGRRGQENTRILRALQISACGWDAPSEESKYRDFTARCYSQEPFFPGGDYDRAERRDWKAGGRGCYFSIIRGHARISNTIAYGLSQWDKTDTSKRSIIQTLRRFSKVGLGYSIIDRLTPFPLRAPYLPADGIGCTSA